MCKNAAKRAKKRVDKEVPPIEGTAQIKPFLKWKSIDKGNRPTKKSKEVVATNVGEKPTNVQVPPPLRHGAGKGLMTGQAPTTKKHPVLLREDSSNDVGLLLFIIKADDYGDLGNHVVEAMGETGLFGLAQVHNH